ncbi:MAG: universal stress protein [Gammaproteobacteria bacterium]|uniref:Universal stress protein n=1 Tax=Candidatus Thiopontia autotrophica TaxID=2841688 RepID=A0A8J6TSI2_9GAMM|nr:universal stress protein [Candidatus Thiopontia autotrophica]
MSHYKKILLAVDFSDASNHVIGKASELAEECDATVDLVHVVEYYQHEFNVDVYLPDLNIENELLQQARDKLHKVAEDMGIPGTKKWLETGSPKSEIVRVATEQECDLIIVGSHGRHGLGLLMGSTANGVLHHAPCDVLAVRVPE